MLFTTNKHIVLLAYQGDCDPIKLLSSHPTKPKYLVIGIAHPRLHFYFCPII